MDLEGGVDERKAGESDGAGELRPDEEYRSMFGLTRTEFTKWKEQERKWRVDQDSFRSAVIETAQRCFKAAPAFPPPMDSSVRLASNVAKQVQLSKRPTDDEFNELVAMMVSNFCNVRVLHEILHNHHGILNGLVDALHGVIDAWRDFYLTDIPSTPNRKWGMELAHTLSAALKEAMDFDQCMAFFWKRVSSDISSYIYVYDYCAPILEELGTLATVFDHKRVQCISLLNAGKVPAARKRSAIENLSRALQRYQELQFLLYHQILIFVLQRCSPLLEPLVEVAVLQDTLLSNLEDIFKYAVEVLDLQPLDEEDEKKRKEKEKKKLEKIAQTPTPSFSDSPRDFMSTLPPRPETSRDRKRFGAHLRSPSMPNLAALAEGKDKPDPLPIRRRPFDDLDLKPMSRRPDLVATTNSLLLPKPTSVGGHRRSRSIETVASGTFMEKDDASDTSSIKSSEDESENKDRSDREDKAKKFKDMMAARYENMNNQGPARARYYRKDAVDIEAERMKKSKAKITTLPTFPPLDWVEKHKKRQYVLFALLTNPISAGMLQRFARSIDFEPPVAFYLKIARYMDLHIDSMERIEAAIQMYNLFLHADSQSPYLLGFISRSQISQVERELSECILGSSIPTNELYSEMQRVCFSVIQEDVLPAFLASKECVTMYELLKKAGFVEPGLSKEILTLSVLTLEELQERFDVPSISGILSSGSTQSSSMSSSEHESFEDEEKAHVRVIHERLGGFLQEHGVRMPGWNALGGKYQFSSRTMIQESDAYSEVSKLIKSQADLFVVETQFRHATEYRDLTSEKHQETFWVNDEEFSFASPPDTFLAGKKVFEAFRCSRNDGGGAQYGMIASNALRNVGVYVPSLRRHPHARLAVWRASSDFEADSVSLAQFVAVEMKRKGRRLNAEKKKRKEVESANRIEEEEYASDDEDEKVETKVASTSTIASSSSVLRDVEEPKTTFEGRQSHCPRCCRRMVLLEKGTRQVLTCVCSFVIQKDIHIYSDTSKGAFSLAIANLVTITGKGRRRDKRKWNQKDNERLFLGSGEISLCSETVVCKHMKPTLKLDLSDCKDSFPYPDIIPNIIPRLFFETSALLKLKRSLFGEGEQQMNLCPARVVILPNDMKFDEFLPPPLRERNAFVRALRVLGFTHVFDSSLGRALQVLETSTDLFLRLKIASRDGNRRGHGKMLPMFTSPIPSIYALLEKHAYAFLPHFATSRSDIQCVGSLCKTYVAGMLDIDASSVFVCAISNVKSAKSDAERLQMSVHGFPSVDVVISTRELTGLLFSSDPLKTINTACSEPIEKGEFDPPFGSWDLKNIANRTIASKTKQRLSPYEEIHPIWSEVATVVHRFDTNDQDVWSDWELDEELVMTAHETLSGVYLCTVDGEERSLHIGIIATDDEDTLVQALTDLSTDSTLDLVEVLTADSVLYDLVDRRVPPKSAPIPKKTRKKGDTVSKSRRRKRYEYTDETPWRLTVPKSMTWEKAMEQLREEQKEFKIDYSLLIQQFGRDGKRWDESRFNSAREPLKKLYDEYLSMKTSEGDNVRKFVLHSRWFPPSFLTDFEYPDFDI